ncbi:MmcQ/YjbR family DNA-binding protein [Bacillus niameyensis]|uniref:MmcQ/YjbR family DNA-binding protein n=1 Tax=Bacillus niameyensis TaxID=1522308 RepID=UPI000B0D829B|nr:MmcQ/YjbR family DNA-binding protein [Bacillus niameyensis]
MKSQEKLQVLLGNACKICLSLPEVVEHIDGFGHTTFQICGKSFVKLTERSGLSFKSNREIQELLLQKKQFFKTPYIGHHGWVLIQTPNDGDWEELTELIQEAYLRAAPKSLVKEWIEQRSEM